MDILNKDQTSSRILLYKPIKILMFYFIGLIILYIWGPFEWRTQNAFLLYMFLFVSQGLIYLGYTTTMRIIHRRDVILQDEENTELLILSHSTILKFLRVFIIINLILIFMFLIRSTGLSSISLDQIINNLVKGITDSGGQYNSKFDTVKVFGGDILAPFFTLMSPLLWPVLPLSLIYFKKLGHINRIFVIITIVLETIRWISTGTNKGVIDLILIIIAVVFLKQWQKRYEGLVSNRYKIGKRIKVSFIIILLVIMGLSVFENNISSRVQGNYYILSLITSNTEVNLDSPLMKLVPQSIQPLLVYSTQYLTQGYYGLSLSLNEPFIPMFGIGNSYFLIENFKELLNVDFFKYTYQARIAYEGWDPLVNWHSVYSWLANDFTYFGVLVLMFFLGKYFAIIYYNSVVLKDPVTSVLFCMLVICFFYFSCNNQVLSSPSTFMAFWGLNALWFYNKKIKRRGRKVVHSRMRNNNTFSKHIR